MIQKIKNYYHLIQALVANIWYGFPSQKLVMIGVTGTDGKTTTSSIIYQILQKAGYKTAMISTVGAYVGDKVYDVGFHVTTPSPFGVQKYLRQAVDQGITHVVLEVTSHALDQNRVWGIHFQVGVLTNVTHEHLDYHKTYEEYVKAKTILLQRSEVAIINQDDASFPSVQALLGKTRVITYGKPLQYKTNLSGTYNQYNASAAGLAAKEVGVSRKIIDKALQGITPPQGRRELVYQKEFSVMVDFAHTPNAFHVLLPELRKEVKGRLIHVFGSAAKRDVTKRPIMGRESAGSADIIILTAEDPRDEPIENICRDIATGITHFKECRADYVPKATEKKLLFIIPDRKTAIQTAIAWAKKGDLVVTTGKSHETSMNYGKGEEPWNEFEVVKEGIAKRKR